jgi:hypothetical protein
MIRQLAIGLALFLTPFTLYWMFLWLARPAGFGPAKDPAWTPIVLRWLTITALLLVIATFVVWAWQTGGAPPNANYAPAHMENGQLVPGTFK